MKCQEAKLKAQGKLQACLKKNSAKVLGGGTDMSAVCQTAFTDALTKIDANAARSEPACRFLDNRDGTVTDLNTGLQWEKKDNLDGVANPSDPHDADNSYTWCIGPPLGQPCTNGGIPDGTVFTDFLYRLNGGTSANGQATSGCFTGHCDWHLPTIEELAAIMDVSQGQCGGGSGACIDPIFGPSQGFYYWSASTDAGSPHGDWIVYFFGFGAGTDVKTYSDYARAVRGGL
jgi:hypothetical protein